MTDDLPATVQAYIDAVNAGDLDAVMTTFADDALHHRPVSRPMAATPCAL